jgi:AcrR family transcriptional regulator
MRKRDDSKEQLILNTALRMIHKAGMSGLKMSDLAKETGLATGTFYIYFKDKNELIRKLYIYLIEKTTSDLLTPIPKRDPLKIKIQKLAFNYLKVSLLHPEYDAFFEQYYRSPFYSETEAEKSTENALMQPIYDLVIQGQKEKIIKDIHAELLVTLVCGMLNELAKTAHYEQRLVTDEEWKDTFNVIWDGIKS